MLSEEQSIRKNLRQTSSRVNVQPLFSRIHIRFIRWTALLGIDLKCYNDQCEWRSMFVQSLTGKIIRQLGWNLTIIVLVHCAWLTIRSWKRRKFFQTTSTKLEEEKTSMKNDIESNDETTSSGDKVDVVTGSAVEFDSVGASSMVSNENCLGIFSSNWSRKMIEILEEICERFDDKTTERTLR